MNHIYEKGSLIKCTVSQQEHFGVFVELEDEEYSGLILVLQYHDRPSEELRELAPKVGQELVAVILNHSPEAKRLALSLKPSDFEHFGHEPVDWRQG